MTPVVSMRVSKNIFYYIWNFIVKLFSKKKKKPYITFDEVVTEQEILEEAEKNEDEDVVILPEQENAEPEAPPAEERAPVNEEEEQLRKLIREALITRNIQYLAVHCTGTFTNATVSGILNYWKNNLRWRNPGYHLMFPYNGGFTYVHDFNLRSNGVADFNATSINISTIGGLDSNRQTVDTMTEQQNRLVEITIEEFIKRFPNIIILGHRGFPNVNKACPCYDVDVKYAQFAPNVRRRL